MDDLLRYFQARDSYVKRLNGIYEKNLENSAVTFVHGWAKFVAPKESAHTFDSHWTPLSPPNRL